MRATLLLALALTCASFEASAQVCAPTCNAQSFSTDPLVGSPPRWTAYSDFSWCPITGDSATQTLSRTFTSSLANPFCDNSTAYARYNGDISRDGCAKYQIVSSDNGSGNHDTGFEPGFVLRHQGNLSGQPLGSAPVDASFFDSSVGAWVVRCETGLNCNTVRLSRVQTFLTAALDCTTFTGGGADPLSEGDWIGACVSGTGTSTKISLFNFGATDPGAPATLTAPWPGVAADHQCVFDAALAAPDTICAAGLGWCDDYGNSWGIWMRTNTVTTGATYRVDNFQAYSCM